VRLAITSTSGACARKGRQWRRAPPARTQQQDAAPAQRNAEVHLDVVDEAQAVEILADGLLAVDFMQLTAPARRARSVSWVA